MKKYEGSNGVRTSHGKFNDYDTINYWWSSTEYSASYGYLSIANYLITSTMTISTWYKNFGMAVRCVMDE
jgi:uncharacterized protein (TIGR02145 family)